MPHVAALFLTNFVTALIILKAKARQRLTLQHFFGRRVEMLSMLSDFAASTCNLDIKNARKNVHYCLSGSFCSFHVPSIR